MINAQELRYGNKLLFIIDDVVTFKNITNIREDGVFWINVLEDFIPQKNFQFKPIPLTEEWLLKLGLEKIGIWTFSLNLVGNLDLIYYLGEKGWSIGLKSYSDFSNLKYVHQLQNLYFSLTGKELTINNKL
jgi:hypothetical protein